MLTELIFIIQNVNDFEICVKKDIKYTQYYNTSERESATGTWSCCFGGLCTGTGGSREEQRLWSQTRRFHSPLCHFQLGALAMLLNIPVLVSSYVKQDNNRTYSAELSRVKELIHTKC